MSIINDALKKTQLNFKKKEKQPEKKPEAQPATEQSPSNVYEKLYKKHTDAKEASMPVGKGPKQVKEEKKASPFRSAKKWLKTSAVTAACLLFLAGSFYFISRLEPVQNFIHSMKKNTASSRTHIVRRPAKKRTYKPGELVLNGTSLIDGKRVALVNDEIYEVGEIISGKTITSINLNQIELRDDERIITLKVH